MVPSVLAVETDRAKRYSTIRLGLSLTGNFLGWAFLLAIVLTGLTKGFESWAYWMTSFPYLALLVFAAIVGSLEIILFFPLTFYSGYILEHRYGLSNHTLRSYFRDKAKGLLVGLAIGIPVLLSFYFFLDTYQENWWIPAGVFAFFFSVVLGRLAPTLIYPLFYTFVPVEDRDLADLIRGRCESVGMTVEGVFQFDMSRTTRKANAAFTGIGKSKRIILADTLIDKFSLEEIGAVLVHELGHFKKKHLWKTLAAGTGLTFFGLFLVSLVYGAWVRSMGIEEITRLSALPLLGVLMGVTGFAGGPIQNIISRRQEREADHFSKDLLQGKAEPLVSALEKLGELNLAERDPHPVVEFLFHSHPSIERRIRLLSQ